jgi:23S rRNA (uracil1939-C5)-methyltransferase
LRHKKTTIHYGLPITAISSEGLGIARLEGKVIFAEGCIPGDVADVKIFKSKASYEEGKAIAISVSSKDRIAPFCSHFGTCGGCKWQFASYPSQLSYKEEIVKSAFERIAKVTLDNLKPIIGCDEITYYRNKLEYTFSNKKWLTTEEIESDDSQLSRDACGFHIPGLFDKVVDVDHCYLQGSISNELRLAIKNYSIDKEYSFYDIKAQQGFLRNLVVKTASTGEVLVLLVVGENNMDKINDLMSFIEEKFPSIQSLQYMINTKRNDSTYDLEAITYSGKAFIVEALGNKRFKIGAKSFFQTNSRQGKILYDIVKEFAKLSKSDIVYDLYTGVGSIAIYMADECHTVVGVEEVKEAIIDANENKKLNNQDNCHFYTGDVKNIINSELFAKHGKPDLIITDPPRSGMHEKVIEELLSVSAPRLIYVSCNPSTQARDIALLSEKYEVKFMQPVDMFPHTKHIENVALLVLRNEYLQSN